MDESLASDVGKQKKEHEESLAFPAIPLSDQLTQETKPTAREICINDWPRVGTSMYFNV